MRDGGMKVKKVYVGKWTLALTFILLGSSILWNMYGTSKIAIGDYYPLVLIFLGLELIIKALMGKGRRISIEGGSIVLMVLIIIFINVMPFTFLGQPSNDLFSEDHSLGRFLQEITQGNLAINFQGMGRFNTEYEIEELFASQDVMAIKVKNVFGNVSLGSWEEEEISITVEVKSNNEDEEYVQGIKEELLSWEILPDGTLVLKSNNRHYLQDSRINSLRMNYQIYVPEEKDCFSIEINNEFGDVNFTEVEGDKIINNRHGDVKVKGKKGFVEVKNHFGDVNLTSLEGEARIQNRHGDVFLKNSDKILERLIVENEFGFVLLQLSQEQSAVLDLRTRFGKVIEDLELTEGGFEEARGVNEEFFKGVLGRGDGEISVSNRHGDIEIEVQD